MRPTWGPSGADKTQVGPTSALWTLLSMYRLHCLIFVLINPVTWITFKHAIVASAQNRIVRFIPDSTDQLCLAARVGLFTYHYIILHGYYTKPARHRAYLFWRLHGFSNTLQLNVRARAVNDVSIRHRQYQMYDWIKHKKCLDIRCRRED